MTKGFSRCSSHRCGCSRVPLNRRELCPRFAVQRKLSLKPPVSTCTSLVACSRTKFASLLTLVTVLATIDRLSLVDEVAKRMPGGKILLQVNATGEEQKGGCLPADVPTLLKHARAMGLDVRGLMTVGPTGSSSEANPTGIPDGCVGLSMTTVWKCVRWGCRATSTLRSNAARPKCASGARSLDNVQHNDLQIHC